MVMLQVIFYICILNNTFICVLLYLGAGSVFNAATGMSVYAACMYISLPSTHVTSNLHVSGNPAFAFYVCQPSLKNLRTARSLPLALHCTILHCALSGPHWR
jgi:hypothetical protein